MFRINQTRNCKSFVGEKALKYLRNESNFLDRHFLHVKKFKKAWNTAKFCYQSQNFRVKILMVKVIYSCK